MTTTTNHLDRFSSQARQAHYWTSFSPEKRGDQLINDYNGQLAEDIEELKTAGIDSETIESYVSRYKNLFSSWLSAKGRCISSMITGPARFPTRKAEKANRSEENHYTLWQEWRKRAKKAIVRKSQPEKTFISELDRYKAELAGMQRNHEIMKICNAIIKKAKGSDCIPALVNAGLSEENARKLMVNRFGYVGYPSFKLTNNNANMKRIEGMIKTLEQKEATREVSPVTKYTFDGGEMIIDYDIDRIQIYFSSRPTTEELNAWKAKGLNSFNWSPSVKAWQRKITANALSAVRYMLPNIQKIA